MKKNKIGFVLEKGNKYTTQILYNGKLVSNVAYLKLFDDSKFEIDIFNCKGNPKNILRNNPYKEEYTIMRLDVMIPKDNIKNSEIKK